MANYDVLITERNNSSTLHIDRMNALEIAHAINEEDKRVAFAVETVLDAVAQTIDQTAAALQNGGRLIYIGAGTSGRLGVMDAAECPPTYGVSPDCVIGLMIGGEAAVFHAQENREDDSLAGVNALREVNLTARDVCVGISASGSAPAVVAALQYAGDVGAVTVALTCNPGSDLTKCAQIGISPVVGPEVIQGSTRMKSATAHKMILNMISTGAMIRIGRVRGNYMVHIRAKNVKALHRVHRIFQAVTGADESTASAMLDQAGGDLSHAIALYEGAAGADRLS